MKLDVKTGTTSFICHIFVMDSSSSVGAGKIGATNASFVCYYMRPGLTGVVGPITINNIATLGTYAGAAAQAAIKLVSDAAMPGIYEFHIPNDCLAAGAGQVVIMLKDAGSNNIAPMVLELQLVAYDPNSVTQAADIQTVKGRAVTDVGVGNTVYLGTSAWSTYAGGDTSGITTLLGRIVGTLAAGTHNPQSGDAYGIVNNGTYGNNALHGEVAKEATLANASYGLDALHTHIIAIPTNPLLTSDARLNNLDATISSRRAPITVDGYTEQQALQVIAAAASGMNVPGNPNAFRGLDKATTRVTGTVAGTERTDVTYNMT